ncbi:hypothetical protein PENTCL1PPCAC_16879, partial [Pristionchus entomophagus]
MEAKRLRVAVGIYAVHDKAVAMMAGAHDDRLKMERVKRDAERNIMSNDASIASLKFLIALESRKRKVAEENNEDSK